MVVGWRGMTSGTSFMKRHRRRRTRRQRHRQTVVSGTSRTRNAANDEFYGQKTGQVVLRQEDLTPYCLLSLERLESGHQIQNADPDCGIIQPSVIRQAPDCFSPSKD